MKQSGRKWVEKVDKSCIRSTKDKTILLECSVMLNYQLEIVGEEFVTSIGHSDEFYVNILFDRYIYRPMCTHMGEINFPVPCSDTNNITNCCPIITISHYY